MVDCSVRPGFRSAGSRASHQVATSVCRAGHDRPVRLAESRPLHRSQACPVLALTRVHLLMTLVALLAGAVLGVAAGILAYRQPRARQAIIGTAGLILTVPSRRQHRLGFRNGEYAWLAL